MGDDHWQATDQGLTREPGYVGGYGEILDWVARIYEATCDSGQPGDPWLRDQLR